MGLWHYKWLSAGDGPIPVFAVFPGTIYTIAASPLVSPLALESLLESLFQSLLERAALERTAFERAVLREE